MKLIDTHTHIASESFDLDRADVLARALEVCEYLVDIGAGTSPDSHQRSMILAEENERVFFTSGIHPHDAATLGLKMDLWEELEQSWKHPKCVAVGECGLDYHYEHSPREDQMNVFKKQIDAAKATNLPLSIHTRDAEEDTIQLLTPYKGAAVFHCFTGSESLAKFALDHGFYISLSGIVTFPKAKELQAIAKNIPLDQLLVETDSPYLAPTPLRGRKNESAFIEYTAKFLADLRGEPLELLKSATTANAKKLFKFNLL